MSANKKDEEWTLNTPLSKIIGETLDHATNRIQAGYYGYLKDDENAAKYSDAKAGSKLKETAYNVTANQLMDLPATIALGGMKILGHPASFPMMATLLGATVLAKSAVDKGLRYNETRSDKMSDETGGVTGTLDGIDKILQNTVQQSHPIFGYGARSLLNVFGSPLKQWNKEEQDERARKEGGYK